MPTLSKDLLSLFTRRRKSRVKQQNDDQHLASRVECDVRAEPSRPLSEEEKELRVGRYLDAQLQELEPAIGVSIFGTPDTDTSGLSSRLLFGIDEMPFDPFDYGSGGLSMYVKVMGRQIYVRFQECLIQPDHLSNSLVAARATTFYILAYNPRNLSSFEHMKSAYKKIVDIKQEMEPSRRWEGGLVAALASGAGAENTVNIGIVREFANANGIDLIELSVEPGQGCGPKDLEPVLAKLILPATSSLP